MRRLSLKRKLQTSQGAIYLTALFVVSFIAVYINVLFTRTMTEQLAARHYVQDVRNFHIAEAGLDAGLVDLKRQLLTKVGFPTDGELDGIQRPQDLVGYTFSSGTPFIAYAAVQPPSPQVLAQGAFQGMQAFSRRVELTSEVTSTTAQAGNARTRLHEQLQIDLIPIFQFAIFDYNDLDLHPGKSMTISGPIHANGRLGLQGQETLTIQGRVTAVGDIIHNQADSDYPSSDVVIFRPSDGTYQSMKEPDPTGPNGMWLESTDPEWATLSLDRWEGHVLAHVNPVGLPLPEGVDPIQIIQPGNAADTPELRAARLYYQAHLRLIDGNFYDANGTLVVPANPSLNPVSAVNPTFWDDRENRSMHVVEVDIQKLRASGLCPDNGIFYIGSPSGITDGVRLINGSQLPSQSDGCGVDGLTVVSHQPLYVKGDYNTIDKQPASLITDAITVLSNAWDDSQSYNPTTSRIASSTTLNAAVIAGRMQVSNSEHLFRLLEDWSGQTFTFTGSDISLWDSRTVGNAMDMCSGGVGCPNNGSYLPPIRVWQFDTSFNDPTHLPPGTPRVYQFTSLIWQQE